MSKDSTGTVLIDRVAKLRQALIGVVGVETKEELEGMKAFMLALPDSVDRTVSLNAINALLETMPS